MLGALGERHVSHGVVRATTHLSARSRRCRRLGTRGCRGLLHSRPAKIVLGRISGPLSSCRSPQAAFKCSRRSDSVTRDSPVALRVRAAQTETQKGFGLGLDGPSLCWVPQCR